MKKVLSLVVLLTLFLAPGICQERGLSPNLASLVAAERAFAHTSVEKGIRESFRMFFAEDGINFQPHPTKTREAILKRPAPATRPPVVLDWQPAYADVSMAGDLGYTTGPYTFTNNSPEKKSTNYGFYFSIWKKQADGSWKVVVDCGIDTPDHSGQKFAFKAAPQASPPRGRARFDLEKERASLVDLDRQFLKEANSLGLVKAFQKYLGDEPRLHRNGMFPLTGRQAIKSFLSTKTPYLTWDPLNSDVSESNDLGYTYGSYELKSPGSSKVEKGYYVRVWKRDQTKKWKLALDTLSPIPPD